MVLTDADRTTIERVSAVLDSAGTTAETDNPALRLMFREIAGHVRDLLEEPTSSGSGD